MSTKEKRPAPRGTAPQKRAKPRPQQNQSRPAPRAQQSQSRTRKARPAQATTRRTQPNQTRVRHPAKPVRRKVAKRTESQVVYTPPKSFNKYHFLLSVISVAAIVLALTLGMSIFFKVENIHVAGMEKYTAWDVRDASGIQEGDNLLTLGKAKVSGKIIARLPYVEQVRIGIKLPDTVNIEVVESDITYAIQAEDNGWWFINSQGRVLEMTTGIIAEYFTKIEGVYIAIPVAGQQAVASTGQPVAGTEAPTDAPDVTDPSGDAADATQATEPPTAPVDTVNAADQLTMAIAILQNLERNGIVGQVTSVNVADLYNMELVYEDRYTVLLGDSSQMDRKIRSMREAVAQMSDYQRGTLDVSFTIWPDKVGYTPGED